MVGAITRNWQRAQGLNGLAQQGAGLACVPALFTRTESGRPPSRHFCARLRTLSSEARSSGTASTLAPGTAALEVIRVRIYSPEGTGKNTWEGWQCLRALDAVPCRTGLVHVTASQDGGVALARQRQGGFVTDACKLTIT